MTKHDAYSADDPIRGAMVGCSCGWRLWLSDVPADVVASGLALDWLLDERERHVGEEAA